MNKEVKNHKLKLTFNLILKFLQSLENWKILPMIFFNSSLFF